MMARLLDSGNFCFELDRCGRFMDLAAKQEYRDENGYDWVASRC